MTSKNDCDKLHDRCDEQKAASEAKELRKKFEKTLKKLLTNKKLSDKITESLASDSKKYLDK